MTPIDWIILFLPLLVVIVIGLKSQKYVNSVADFLAAGRVAGRYVICVASAEAGMGLITLVGQWEMYYNSGFGIGFWNAISAPLGLLFGLFGYCTYRYRETKAMTMGQFLETRYNRPFRIFAAILQTISGVLNYAIFPAVSARCLMYFLDLPVRFTVCGWTFSTFGVIMLLCLSVAVFIITMGGQVTIMVTDCVQGLVSYPLYAIIVFYLVYRFSWSGEVVPTLLDRPRGMSLLNPYDTGNLRNFNLFYIFVGIVSNVFNRMSWCGSQSYNASARNAHEQKMGALLGTWRAGFSSMMIILLAIAAYTCIHHANYKPIADAVNTQLTATTIDELASDAKFDPVRNDLDALARDGVISDAMRQTLGDKAPATAAVPPEQRKEVAQAIVATIDKGTAKSIGTIHHQMLVPVTLRELLPMGITGGLCALMLFLMLSTDTTYIHSWGSIIAQDLILPFLKKPLTPKQQLNLIRCCIIFVAVFAFFFSFFFAQMDYVLMFFAITGAIWLGGAGPVIVFGLYWKRGTTAGAFSSLIAGSSLAVGGIVCQKTWVQYLYPYLDAHQLTAPLNSLLQTLTRPFHPLISWEVTPNAFPINSQEIYFIAMLASIFLYVLVSLATCRKPFNMDRMLHRGAYAESEPPTPLKWSLANLCHKLIGIDGNYSKGDRILARCVFIWSFGWGFCVCFLAVIVWNAISPWPSSAWAVNFLVVSVIVPGIVAVISTFWFFIGGCMGLRQLFRDLAQKQVNHADNGTVQHNDTAQHNDISGEKP